jgi:hypothetical protein
MSDLSDKLRDIATAIEEGLPLDKPSDIAAILDAADKIDFLKSERRCLASHATGGGTTGDGQTLNDICVQITAFRNRLYAEVPKEAADTIDAQAARIAELVSLAHALDEKIIELKQRDLNEIEAALIGFVSCIRDALFKEPTQ